MCFSASASFGAGVVLSTIGFVSLKKAKVPSQIVFASIPLLFAVQQVAEGFLWLALSDPAYAFLQQFTTHTFLFFAQVVWPLWVPLAIFLLEKEEKRKAFQLLLLGIGTLVSFYLAYCLAIHHVQAKIIGYHVSYEQDYPKKLGLYGGGLYIAATILPAFLSSVKRMWMLGAAILISYIVTAIFYKDYIISVWCFFASIISIAVYVVLYEAGKSEKKIPAQVM